MENYKNDVRIMLNKNGISESVMDSYKDIIEQCYIDGDRASEVIRMMLSEIYEEIKDNLE